MVKVHDEIKAMTKSETAFAFGMGTAVAIETLRGHHEALSGDLVARAAGLGLTVFVGIWVLAVLVSRFDARKRGK